MKIRNLLLFLFATLLIQASYGQKKTSPVAMHGHLHIEGNKLLDEHNQPVQFKGMSFFWSQWMPQYYNKQVVSWLADDWKCSIVRAAMAVDHGGYLENPYPEMGKVETIVKAAQKKGIYVIIDFHAHEAHTDIHAAKVFFAEMAQQFGHLPNVIYETFNEPLQYPSWDTILKPYHEAIIDTIRHHDPDNIIVCGTRQWSQLVEEAAKNPIKDTNIAYTLHYYANTHKEYFRQEATRAMELGACLMVTEFGICSANGNGDINYEESELWFDFLEKNNISWCNWSVSDKEETASILKPDASSRGFWAKEELTESGIYIRKKIRGDNE